MNKTIKKCYYHLRYDSDRDAIGFDAQANGCEFFIKHGQTVIAMWENNPYNSWFALKYSKAITAIKQEDWYI